MTKLEKLWEYQDKITHLQCTINILNWELRINAPKDSSDYLIKVITDFENQLFELQTSKEYGVLLNDVIKSKDFKSLEEPEQRYIENLLRHYNKSKNVPADFFMKYAELKNQANVVWKKAKENNDYESFKPYLKDIIEITKQYYKYIDPKAKNLYDVMLNEYETGITSKTIDELFNELKAAITPIIKMQKGIKNNRKYTYTQEELMECAKYLLNYIGFDMNKGALGIYPHGFSEKMNSNDVRIAFEHSTNPFTFVATIIHEGGHGIFEQRIAPNLSRYDNNSVDNLYALHESQSRFFENILGRRKSFWVPIYDDIKRILHLDLSLDEFVNELNVSTPGLIRTESDELTYCMHIIVRYEMEIEIFNNNADIDSLPKLWNQKMKEYLGVEVDSDANGLMQDVHWSEGNFGYFPSYLLGTIFDGMFLKCIERDLGNIDELLEKGNIKEITKYLTEKIYVNGGAYTSLEILENMYGELSSKPIIEYFENKFQTLESRKNG